MSSSDPAFADFLAAIETTREKMEEMKISRYGSADAKTRFGSIYSIDDWADDFKGIFENKEDWWKKLEGPKTRRMWLSRIKKSKGLSIDLYNGGFPSFERTRGNLASPAGRLTQSWLQDIITSDLAKRFKEHNGSVSVSSYSDINSIEAECTRVLQELKGLGVGGRRRFPHLEEFIHHVFNKEHKISLKVARQVLASLQASFDVCSAGHGGQVPAFTLDFYLPSVDVFANICGEDLVDLRHRWVYRENYNVTKRNASSPPPKVIEQRGAESEGELTVARRQHRRRGGEGSVNYSPEDRRASSLSIADPAPTRKAAGNVGFDMSLIDRIQDIVGKYEQQRETRRGESRRKAERASANLLECYHDCTFDKQNQLSWYLDQLLEASNHDKMPDPTRLPHSLGDLSILYEAVHQRSI